MKTLALAQQAHVKLMAGIALYERAGFRQVGVYREQGWLDGRWVDTVIMEKLL